MSVACCFGLESAHTYRECHILVDAVLQQAQYCLLGVSPRYDIYLGLESLAPKLPDDVCAAEQRCGREYDDQFGIALATRRLQQLNVVAEYDILVGVADYGGNQLGRKALL